MKMNWCRRGNPSGPGCIFMLNVYPEMPRLKKILLLLIIIPGALFAQRDAGDTLLIKRPQYLGIFIGRLQYAGPDHYLYQHDPIAILGIDQVLKLTVGNAIHG